MSEEALKLLAQQLRKPSGEMGIQVGKNMNVGNEKLNMWTIEQLNIFADDNILEIGMGNGAFVKNILNKDNSVKYMGCDYSDVMVEEAETLNEQFIKTNRAKFYLSSADKLPFEAETFNKIFTVNTIYFWDEPKKVLSELHRVLKSKGILLITLSPKSIVENIPVTKYGFNIYSNEELKNLLEESNFSVKEILERQEPDAEMNGRIIKFASMLVCAEKL